MSERSIDDILAELLGGSGSDGAAPAPKAGANSSSPSPSAQGVLPLQNHVLEQTVPALRAQHEPQALLGLAQQDSGAQGQGSVGSTDSPSTAAGLEAALAVERRPHVSGPGNVAGLPLGGAQHAALGSGQPDDAGAAAGALVPSSAKAPDSAQPLPAQAAAGSLPAAADEDADAGPQPPERQEGEAAAPCPAPACSPAAASTTDEHWERPEAAALLSLPAESRGEKQAEQQQKQEGGQDWLPLDGAAAAAAPVGQVAARQLDADPAAAPEPAASSSTPVTPSTPPQPHTEQQQRQRQQLSPALHEQALLEAEEREHALLSGGGYSSQLDPLAELMASLSAAPQDWPSLGRPDAAGAMIGGRALMKLQALGDLPHRCQQLGLPQCVALSGAGVAVGTALGAVLLGRLASPPSTAAQQGGGAGAASAVAQGGATLSGPWLQLGEPSSEAEGVTALGFSTPSGPVDPVWLLAGHASGSLTVWDVARRPARQVAQVAQQHALPLVHVSFLPGRGVSSAVSLDRRGRLVLHTIASVLMRTAVTSRTLLDGQYGPLLSLAHLQPTPLLALPPQTTSRGPSDAGGPTAPHATTAGPPTASGEDSSRAGDGMAVLCSPSHVYIARFKPSGELLLMCSIPRPQAAPPSCWPSAAWLPHHRLASGSSGSPAVAVRCSQSLVAPCAILALGWGSTLSFFEVPLVGDHQQVAAATAASSGDATPIPSPGSSSGGAGGGWEAAGGSSGGGAVPSLAQGAAAMAAAAAAARRGTQFMRSAGSSSARQQAQQLPAAAELLTQQQATELAASLPLSLLRSWDSQSLGHQDDDLQLVGGPSPTGSQAVLGLHWLDAESVCLVLSQGVHLQLAVVGQPAGEVREQMAVADAPMPLMGSAAAVTGWAGGSIAGSGSMLLLLGESACCHVARLMGWQERLRTLQAIGKHKLGMWFALQMHAAAQQAHAAGQKDGAAAVQQLEQWVLGLMLRHVGDVLGQPYASRAAWCSAVQDAALLAVSACDLLRIPQVLFERAFPLFRDAPAAPSPDANAGAACAAGSACLSPTTAGPDSALQLGGNNSDDHNGDVSALGLFLERLERHVVCDAFSAVPPEAMRALVGHFAGRLERMERMLLHLTVSSMDLDQVLRLCEAHGLHSGLAYVYSRLGDYARPVYDLLRAVAAAPCLRQRRHVGYKLLVYLRCLFRNQAWPPGTGPLPAGRHDQVKAQLLGLLLYSDAADLAREWRLPAAELQAAAGICAADPCPALQLLLRVDTSALISVLWEAVDGWDVVETDMRSAAGKPLAGEEEGAARVSVASQVVVDALVGLQLLSAGRREAGSAPGWQEQQEGTEEEAGEDWSAVMAFVASLVAAGRVAVAPAFGLQLLRHIAAAARPPGSSSSEAAVSAWRRQQDDLFLQVVSALGVNAPGQPPEPGRMDGKAAADALALAQASGFWRSAAQLLHLLQRTEDVLRLHLQQPALRPQLFAYIDAFMQQPGSAGGGGSRREAAQRLRAALYELLPELVQADGRGTARAIMLHFPGDVERALRQLEPSPADQFAFLHGAVAEYSQMQAAAAAAAPAALGDGPNSSKRARPPAVADPIGSPAICNLYLRLLCQHKPAAVLPFLQSHGHYDVQQGIQQCREAGAWEAQAYLHERMGELEAALQLHLQQLRRAHAALEAALADGTIAACCTSPGPASGLKGAPASPVASGMASPVAGRSPVVPAQQLLRNGFAAGPAFLGAPGAASSPPPQPNDLHLAWLAQLSSRLRAVLPADAVAAAQLQAHPQAAKPPAQLKAAWQALQAAIAFCQRNTTPPEPSLHAAANYCVQRASPDSGSGSAHWYQLLQVYVHCLRRTSLGEPPVCTDTAAANGTPSAHSGKHSLQNKPEEPEDDAPVPAGCALVLRAVYTACLQEAITCAAEFLPLSAIMQHLISAFARHTYGGLRTTLLALFAACHCEHAIVGTASQLINNAVYASLRETYQAMASALPQAALATACDAPAAAAAVAVPFNGPASARPPALDGDGESATGERQAAEAAASEGPKVGAGWFQQAAARSKTAHRACIDVRQLMAAADANGHAFGGAAYGGLLATAGNGGGKGHSAGSALLNDSTDCMGDGMQHRLAAAAADAAGLDESNAFMGCAAEESFDVDELLAWSSSRLAHH